MANIYWILVQIICMKNCILKHSNLFYMEFSSYSGVFLNCEHLIRFLRKNRVFYNRICMHILSRDEFPSITFCFIIGYTIYHIPYMIYPVVSLLVGSIFNIFIPVIVLDKSSLWSTFNLDFIQIMSYQTNSVIGSGNKKKRYLIFVMTSLSAFKLNRLFELDFETRPVKLLFVILGRLRYSFCEPNGFG